MGNQMTAEATQNIQSMVNNAGLTRAQCLECVKVDGDALEFMSLEYQADIEIATIAVSKSPMALRHASPELRSNKDLIRIAMKTHTQAFISVTAAIKNDRPFIVELIETCHPDNLYFIIENVPAALIDREIGLMVARKCDNKGNFSKGYFYVLSCLPTPIRQDKEVVLVAIKNGNRMGRLLYDRPDLLSDVDVMKEVIRSTPADFGYMSRELAHRYDISWYAMETNGTLFKHLKDEYRADPKFLLLALKTSPSELQHASAELQATKHIAEIAVGRCGTNFYHISEELKTDPELVKLAVSYDAKCFRWVKGPVQTHPCLQLFAFVTAKTSCEKVYIVGSFDPSFSGLDRLKKVIQEKTSFMMASHVQWGPKEVTSKRALAFKPPIHMLNDQGPFMALKLKRDIAGFLGIDLFWDTRKEDRASIPATEMAKRKAAAVFAPMLNEACAARGTTAFKMAILLYDGNLTEWQSC